MKKAIITQAQLQKYLTSRLNLSIEIIVHLCNDIVKECEKLQIPLNCLYMKDNDRIYLSQTSFSVIWWLQKNYTQCSACGTWYTPNASETIFATSQTIMYSRRKGYEVTLPNCAPCTLEWPNKTIHTLDSRMMDYDTYKADYRDCFYPITHSK